MKLADWRIFLAPYDLWVGAYWSRKDTTLYICVVPMVALALHFERSPK